MMERDMRPPGALNIGGGLPDHVRGQINADDPATWAHLLCRGKLHGPSTGGHVQHGSPRREVGLRHEPLPKVGEELWTNAVIRGRRATKHADDPCLLCAGCLLHGFSPFL
jgi:hypothetical protein